MANTDTFESLILEAKAAGTSWKRDPEHRVLQCENGRCVLGAVVKARKTPNFTTLPNPTVVVAMEELGISHALAYRIVQANDWGEDANRADIELMDKMLEVTYEES